MQESNSHKISKKIIYFHYDIFHRSVRQFCFSTEIKEINKTAFNENDTNIA